MERKFEKVISICDKDMATAEEILDGCGAVCRAVLGKKKDEGFKGYLSCSITRDGTSLALCIWKQKGGRYEKIEHVVVHVTGMIILRGIIDHALAELVAKKNP